MARTFDPVGAFQGARSNANVIKAQEQSIDAAPVRNQLANLQLGQAQVGAQRKETEFGQTQAIQKAKILNQTFTALRGVPLQQRDQAFAAIAPQLQQFGIDTSSFEPGELTDAGLDQGIFESQSLIGGPVAPKQTSLQQNLQAAGLQPGTPEFQQAVLSSVAPPTTIIGSGEKQESKGLADVRVKRFSKLQDAADQAVVLIDNLDQLDLIDVEKGALEPAKARLAAIAEGFGIDASGLANATGAQAFNAVSTKLVNDILNAATGPQTDQDALRAKRTIADIGDTPEAATFKNDSLRSLALRQVEQRDFIVDLLNDDKSLTQANAEWEKFKKKTPSLSSTVKGPNGLPLFFFQFKESSKQRRPGITDQEIIEAWRGGHGK